MKKLLTIIAVLITINCTAQKVVKDTLIVSEKIKWIKINGELFEVKKTITLEKFNYMEGEIINIDTLPRRWFSNNLPNIIYTQK
jgi:hypothetical protein